MLPNVPVSVWEQISVVVIFSFLLAGMGYVLLKIFSKAIADINKYYAEMVEKNNTQFSTSLLENNKQWQLYFDARSETSKLVDDQIVDKLSQLTIAIEKLASDFGRHDLMERQALDEMGDKRKLLKSPRKKRGKATGSLRS